MAENRQEEQTIGPNLFPLEIQPVLTAFENLNPREDSFSVKSAEDEESRILRETNPHALTSFEELLDSYTEDHAAQFRRGNLICHQALRLEAISRGGVLPTFTEQFVQDYDMDQERRAEEEVVDKQLQRRPYQVSLQKRRANVTIFRNLEPEFSKIVEKELGVELGWLPEKDYTYSGIIYLYSLFRKGCSNPKNFRQGS